MQVALVSQLNGMSVLLFHMEHCDVGQVWSYRLWDEEGKRWGDAVDTKGQSVVVQLTKFDGVVRALVEMNGEQQEAQPMQFGKGAAKFQVTVKRPFPRGKGDHHLVVCAAVRGHAAGWKIDLPDRDLEPGDVLQLKGDAIHLGEGQTMLSSGEFHCEDDGFEVFNLGGSQATLLPCKPGQPSALPYTGTFFVKTGRLREEDVQKLKQA